MPGWRRKTHEGRESTSLFRISCKRVIDGVEYLILQYMECSNLLDDIYQRLGCVCLGWSSDVEVHYRQVREMAGETNASCSENRTWS